MVIKYQFFIVKTYSTTKTAYFSYKIDSSIIPYKWRMPKLFRETLYNKFHLNGFVTGLNGEFYVAPELQEAVLKLFDATGGKGVILERSLSIEDRPISEEKEMQQMLNGELNNA